MHFFSFVSCLFSCDIFYCLDSWLLILLNILERLEIKVIILSLFQIFFIRFFKNAFCSSSNWSQKLFWFEFLEIKQTHFFWLTSNARLRLDISVRTRELLHSIFYWYPRYSILYIKVFLIVFISFLFFRLVEIKMVEVSFSRSKSNILGVSSDT